MGGVVGVGSEVLITNTADVPSVVPGLAGVGKI
jgi:hypothetical protein